MNKRKIITAVMVFALIFALCSCAHPGTGDIAESSKNTTEPSVTSSENTAPGETAGATENNSPDETTDVVTTQNSTGEGNINEGTTQAVTVTNNVNTTAKPSESTTETAFSSDSTNRENELSGMKAIGEGIYITDLTSYSGAFVEDGSNEKVKNIASLDLVNEGSADIQYIEISVKTEKETYEFVATTLIRGIKVTVLEKDRKPFEKNAVIVSAQIKAIAPFQSEISVCRDDFEVQIMDSVMNLRNISDKDYSSTVFVYYKNYVGDGFLGGITYRVRFDTIGAGELRQMSSSNLVKGTSKVVFITTGE